MPAPLSENAVLQERYRIVQCLHESPEGSTYLAADLHQPEEERKCVLREYIFADDLPDRGQRAELLYDALEYLEGLSHPNLARMLDLFSHQDRPIGVFEYVAGDTLQEWCSFEKVRLTETQIYDWSLQIADGLTCLHQHQPPFIVGELDARHIVVGAGGQLKIVGFGLRRLQRRLDRGTLPPLFSAQREHVRGDIRALGRLIVMLMSRVEEPSPDTWAFPSPSRMSLHRIISRCLSHESDFAYQAMREVLDDLCRVDRTTRGLGRIRRPAAEAETRWWEPEATRAILPINPPTGRLSFVSARRSWRRRVLTAAAFLAAVALMVAWGLRHVRRLPPATFHRRGPVIYAIAGGNGGLAAALGEMSAHEVDRVSVPDRVLRAAAGTRLALLATEQQVLALDTRTDRVEQTFDTLGGSDNRGIPQDVAVTPDDAAAYVLFNGEVDRVDVASGVLAPVATTAIGPGGILAVSPNGATLVVARAGSRVLEIFDAARQRKIGEVSLPDKPGVLCFSPDGGSLYLTLPRLGTVARVASAHRRLEQRFSFRGSPGPTALACAPDGRSLFVGLKRARAIAVLAAPDLQEVARMPCDGVPGSMVTTRNGRLWVATWGSPVVRIFDVARKKPVASVSLTSPVASLVLAR